MAFGTVGTNILFAINTTGVAKSKAQWGLIAAAIAAVGVALNNLRKSATEFSNIWNKLSDEQRDAARAADAAAKGMIDTTEALRGQAIQMKAGIEVSREFSVAMAKLVTVEGQRLGKTAKEITADFIKLTEGIAKGSTRATKEFGIEIENTEDLLLAQNEAIIKVTQAAQGLEVAIDDVDKSLFALSNSMDTNIGLAFDWVRQSTDFGGAIGEITAGFDAFNNLLMDTDGALLDHIITWQNFGNWLGLVARGPLSVATGELDDFLFKMKSAIVEQAGLARGRKLAEQELAAIGTFVGPRIEDAGPIRPTGPRKGGRRKPIEEMVFTEEDVRQFEAMDITGAAVGGPEDLAAAIAINDILLERIDIAAELKSIEDAEVTQEDRFKLRLEQAQREEELRVQQQEFVLENRDEMWQLELEQAERERTLQEEKHEWLLENSARYRDAQLQIARQEMMGRIQFMGQMFGNISALMNTENRKLFAIGKAAAIASATINTASAAVKAYEVGMQAGFPVGLVLGPAAAAAAVVAGGVQIAKIAQTEFGSGASGIGGGAAGAPGGASFGGGAFTGGTAQTPVGGGTTSISITIGDETLQEILINSNDAASQKGFRAFAMAG
jgi:hypothetical protein